MKKVMLILVLISVMFLASCIGDQMIWEKFDPATKNRTGKLTVSALSGMVNKKFGSLKLVIIIKDGNDMFKGSFAVADFNQTDSPESAEAIFGGMTEFATGGTSKAVENLTE